MGASENLPSESADVTDWNVLDYFDPAPAGSIRLIPDSNLWMSVPAPEPKPGQRFVWSSCRFPSGSNEVSFEEQLASLHQARRYTQQKVKEKSAEQKLLEAEAVLQEAHEKKAEMLKEVESIRARHTEEMERQRITLDEDRRNLETQRQQMEILVADLEAEKREIEAERQASADLGEAIEHDLKMAEIILKGMVTTLTGVSKDLNKNGTDPLDALLNLAYGLQSYLEDYAGEKGHATVNTLMEITAKIINDLNDQRCMRASAVCLPPNAASIHVVETRQMERLSIRTELTVPMQTQEPASLLSSQPFSQPDNPINSQIRALFNQTNSSFYGESVSDEKSIAEEPRLESVAKQSLVPVRQAFMPVRQSEEEPHSLPEKNSPRAEIEPISAPPSFGTDFVIYQDESVLASKSTEAEIIDAADVGPQIVITEASAAVKEVISGSAAAELNPGFVIHQDESFFAGLVSDKEAVETPKETVESDQYEADENAPPEDVKLIDISVQNIPALKFELPQPLPPNKPAQSTRLSNVLFEIPQDFNSEFDISRRSIGRSQDQTMPFDLPDEEEFQNHITNKRFGASTPKSKDMHLDYGSPSKENDPEFHQQPRPTNYGLSPILEGSTEKTSSTGATTVNPSVLQPRITSFEASVAEEDEPSPLIDPYNDPHVLELKQKLCQRNVCLENAAFLEEAAPNIVSGRAQVKMDNMRFNVEAVLGRGNFAVVYAVRCRADADNAWALKVQQKDGLWDSYIHTVLLERLRESGDFENKSKYVIGLHRIHIFNDGVTHTYLPLYEQNIVDLIATYQRSPEKTVPELLAMKLTVDVLKAVEIIHSCGIVHGDIKADNFLLRSMLNLIEAKNAEQFMAANLAVLADFGCGIDMGLFPSNVRFTAMKCGKSTAGNEILGVQPWTYHIDFFGILDVIHSLLFGEYMKLYEEAGRWKITKSFKRSWSEIWETTFHRLLNVPTCDELPVLSDIRAEFEAAIVERLKVTDIDKFTRKMRVCVFMQRQSCYLAMR